MAETRRSGDIYKCIQLVIFKRGDIYKCIQLVIFKRGDIHKCFWCLEQYVNYTRKYASKYRDNFCPATGVICVR